MSEDYKPMILIVDRQLSTLTSLDSLLSREGFRVATCSSSAEALKAVAALRHDLVIVGKVGPDHDGAAVVSRIKILSPATNVLLLLDSNDDSVVAEAIVAGADGLLRRSYSDSQVIQRVERLLHVVHN